MKTYKLAILGAGAIANAIADAVQRVDGMELYAVAARDAARASAFCDKWGGTVSYGSYEEMLRDNCVDIVYVATPHSLHYEHTRLCLEHGKAVLCEKAFTGNAKQAEALVELANVKKLFLTEAIWPRYMPVAKKMRELVDGGAIGTPCMVTGNLGAPLAHLPRMARPELAGGALLDLGVYPLTFASIAFGGEVQRTAITATMTETGVDGQEGITLEYPGGRLAVLHSTMLGCASGDGYVYGDKGRLYCDNITSFKTLILQDDKGNEVERFARKEGFTGYEYELMACVEGLENGWVEHPDMPHAETLRIMRLLDSLRASFGLVYPFD